MKVHAASINAADCQPLGQYHRGGFLFPVQTRRPPTYPSLYDKFLLAVSLVINGVTVWCAWNWG